jgi:predicted PurR-regulated permease PerM
LGRRLPIAVCQPTARPCTSLRPFALAVIAALLTFIPYLGAIVSAVLAIIVTLPMGWPHVLAVIAIYVIAPSSDTTFSPRTE